MPQDASCPTCRHPFPVTEARSAFTVACPACDAEMTVEFKKPAAPPEPGQPHYDLLVKPGALAAAPAPPPARRKKDDEDDEPARAGGSAMVVLLSGGLGLLFVLGGLGLTAWVLFEGIGRETASGTPTSDSRPNNSPNNPNRPNPRPVEPPNPRPNQPNNSRPNNPRPVEPPKPKDWFELKPATGPVPPITPPQLPDDVSNIDLAARVGPGAKVGSVAVGGGGRYIVMHFPDKGRLGVFDVSTAGFATVQADTGDLVLTAGLSTVVTCVAHGSVFRVYDLPDLAKRYDHSAPGGTRAMAMGSRTNGPLLTIATFAEVKLWDVGAAAMTEVEGASVKPRPEVHWHEKCARAAPDGTAFSTHDGFRPDQKTTLLVEQNRRWKTLPDVAAVPFPGADGNFYGNGVVVDKNGRDMQYGGVGAGSGTWFLPSVSDKNYFLKIAPLTIGTGLKARRTLTVSVHKGRNSDTPAAGTAVLADEPDFEGMTNRFNTEPAVVYDQHFFLIPEAKLLVTLNGKKDRLVLRKLDIK